jgi:protein TonB
VRLGGSSPETLGPGTRRALAGAMLGAHLLAGWALLQVPAVRQAAAEVAPIMVDLIAPTPEAPRPPPPPALRPKTPPPPPAPVLAARPAVPVAQPSFTAPPPPELPAPAAPIAPPQPPAPPAPPAPAVAPAPAPAAPRTVVLTDSDWVRVPDVEYPLAARRLREEGTVIVRALIDTRGAPKQVVLQRSSGHSRLDQAALRAAMGARVRPRTENGVPFEFWIAMPLAFELED